MVLQESEGIKEQLKEKEVKRQQTCASIVRKCV